MMMRALGVLLFGLGLAIAYLGWPAGADMTMRTFLSLMVSGVIGLIALFIVIRFIN
jgi:hypothetical protein